MEDHNLLGLLDCIEGLQENMATILDILKEQTIRIVELEKKVEENGRTYGAV